MKIRFYKVEPPRKYKIIKVSDTLENKQFVTDYLRLKNINKQYVIEMNNNILYTDMTNTSVLSWILSFPW